MDFEKLCMMFTMREPYYGILLSSMMRVSTDKVQTLGVGRSGNVFRLYYNKAFVEGLPIDTAVEVIKHEVLHLALNHFTIFEEEADSQDEQMVRNIAADMEVNGYLNKTVLAPINPVLAEDMGWQSKLGTREYYKRLKSQNQQQQQQQQQQAQAPQQPCNGGLGGNSQQQNQPPQQSQKNSNQQQVQPQNQQPSPSSISGQGTGASQPKTKEQQAFDKIKSTGTFDDHSMWPDCDSDEAKDLLQQAVDDLLVQAEEETVKACGSIPSEMRVLIEKIKARKPKPVTNWKRYFRRYIGNEFSDLIRKSKKRESRRFPDAAGNRHKRKSHILVAIDTSGSISMPDYREFFGQIKTLMKDATFHVLECDTTIRHEYDFTGIIREDVYGGGGTNFQPPVDYFKSNKKKYDALVYFTDGYARIPEDTPRETLWVVCSSGDKNRSKYIKNGASVVFISSNSNK